MQITFIAAIYFIFFLSGAAALIYEVLWVRYLSLIFGGSHLAVTTVLAVFMGGLALGSFMIGRKIANAGKLLRLYGFLELGVALSALLFMGLVRFYPLIYVPLAQINETSPLYLSVVRVLLGVIALILPTTLMGGTLPVLSAFVSHRFKGLGSRLSFLYGFNTIGAVMGAAVTGFYFLVNYSVSTTLLIAISINIAAGFLAIALQKKAPPVPDGTSLPETPTTGSGSADGGAAEKAVGTFPYRLVLWGIGVSGFCALGYEVLWTRVLSIVIGATTYGFTILLMAFLAGIGLGSGAFGILARLRESPPESGKYDSGKAIVLFGLVQVIIGVSALLVSLHIRDLPEYSALIRDMFHSATFRIHPFKTTQLVNFVLTFSFMFVPAFFMGVAFPLAGKIHGHAGRAVGNAVGEVLSSNTVGAILGSAVSGFVLIYLIGIQRSLQIIVLINIGFGLLVMASVRGSRILNWLVCCAAACSILVPVLRPAFWQIWDPRIYAFYQAGNPLMFSTPEKTREVLANNRVRYYAEGTNSIISSVQSGDALFFITNGRVEASNDYKDRQCQYTLGHLPMLLNRNPRKVFVLGTGSGMTLGAVSVHPEVEQITLAEIEPKVLGVARTFGVYNHYVLNRPNPKLKVVFNDGRNFLMTTREKFDVITADPVHPWFSGAGYLYTTEYFRAAAEHLNPGGIICQWLPLYELTEENLQSVVGTFRQNFKYTMIWLTYYDAELVGSNSPIIIDEQELDRRIRAPEVMRDLETVNMGSAEDFLSYFLMGSRGTRDYGEGGTINTDDNLYLELSAPHSLGKTRVLASNVMGLMKYRENILPYLRAPESGAERAKQADSWARNGKAAEICDRAHIMLLTGYGGTPDYQRLITDLEAKYPGYAPERFLVKEENESTGRIVGKPRLIRQVFLDIVNKRGETAKMQFAAVLFRVTDEKARLFIVDNASHLVFGKMKVRGANPEQRAAAFAEGVFRNVEDIYGRQRKQAATRGGRLPDETALFPEIKHLVESKVEQAKE